MAEALGCLPREVTIVGVQPKQLDWTMEMSPEVSRSLPGIVGAVLQILGSPSDNPVREE